MTALAELLKARIARTGPITVADFMAECLLHPQHGYYATRDPLGQTGDFTTAPEISQMFGEVLGLAIAQAWMDQGQPSPFALVELGPGRGTLMADILRATAKVPGFSTAAQVHFIEASPNLRKSQAEAVTDAQWHDDIQSLPALPLFVVANEFFDALPIRQFVRQGNGWSERMVGLDGDTLQFGQSVAAPLGILQDRLADTDEGDLVEYCPALPAIVQGLAEKIDTHGGIALFIDYGDWGSQGDTLQALQAHAHVDPLTAPGQVDLTAHVDFAAIAASAAPARYTRLTPQGVFLERLGITQRAQALAKGMSDAALKSHIAAHRRLTHPAEMGDLFKVIGLYPKTAAAPPGLAP